MAEFISDIKFADPLVIGQAHNHGQPVQRSSQLGRKIAALSLVMGALWLLSTYPRVADHTVSLSEEDVCLQVQPWKAPGGAFPPSAPSSDKLASLISGAVQVNTSVYDDYPLPVSSSPQVWQDTFGPMREYLRSALPLIHTTDKVKKELINEHGLLYTWTGSEESLKPIVFMAHQDVVPVDPTTISRWTHPPFSGYIDQEKGLVYGRGAMDDKASLISLMASFESLLELDFKPHRSIILSFGFDEEASGTQGAEALANYLESVYGKHQDGKGVLMIVDEGNGVDATTFGIPIAAPAVSEKGYLDAKVTVNGKGGHSSQPPKHTTIGILSKIIGHIEDNPHIPSLVLREDGNKEDSPGLKTMLCVRDAPKVKGTSLGRAVEKLIEARKKLANTRFSCNRSRLLRSRAKKALEKARDDFLQIAREEEALGEFVTTQAVDLIHGGVKINALPEEASAIINHRINVEDTVEDVRTRLTKLVEEMASKYDCQVAKWGNTKVDKESHCVVVLEDAFESALEPAPRTPTEGKEASPYRLLSSVIRRTWPLGDNQYIRVVPTLMQGNTDTKSYHALSRHIFRFAPTSLDKLEGPQDGGIHTVDERVQIDTLTKGFEFYTSLMTAVQEQTLP